MSNLGTGNHSSALPGPELLRFSLTRGQATGQAKKRSYQCRGLPELRYLLPAFPDPTLQVKPRLRTVPGELSQSVTVVLIYHVLWIRQPPIQKARGKRRKIRDSGNIPLAGGAILLAIPKPYCTLILNGLRYPRRTHRFPPSGRSPPPAYPFHLCTDTDLLIIWPGWRHVFRPKTRRSQFAGYPVPSGFPKKMAGAAEYFPETAEPLPGERKIWANRAGIMPGKCQYARIWPLPAGVIRSLRCIVPFPPVRHLHPRGIARPPVMVACRRLETSRVSLTPQFLLSPTVLPSLRVSWSSGKACTASFTCTSTRWFHHGQNPPVKPKLKRPSRRL